MGFLESLSLVIIEKFTPSTGKRRLKRVNLMFSSGHFCSLSTMLQAPMVQSKVLFLTVDSPWPKEEGIKIGNNPEGETPLKHFQDIYQIILLFTKNVD